MGHLNFGKLISKIRRKYIAETIEYPVEKFEEKKNIFDYLIQKSQIIKDSQKKKEGTEKVLLYLGGYISEIECEKNGIFYILRCKELGSIKAIDKEEGLDKIIQTLIFEKKIIAGGLYHQPK